MSEQGLDRRSFLWAGGALGLASLAGFTVPPRRRVADLVLRNAVVYDGTGGPPRDVDVAVTGDRITRIGQLSGVGAEEVDLTGLALAPGFVDIHSHADMSLFVEPRAESRIRQGVTLEVVGQDGNSIGPWGDEQYRSTRERYRERHGVEIDFHDVPGFLRAIDRIRPAVNVASMVGHGTVRGYVMGGAERAPNSGELARMKGLVREALEGGAVGLSSGLEYTPGGYADPEELVALARELRGTGVPYASHMRNEDDRLLSAVEEALHVGRMAEVPVQISHLKAQGERNWWKADVALETIEKARASGVDVHFDRYPYVAYATGLSNLFPAWARAGGNDAFIRRLQDPEVLPRLAEACRAKVELLGSWDAVQISSVRDEEISWARGRRLGELAEERGVDPFVLTVDLLVRDGGRVGMIGFGMSEENTGRILAHELGMVCSDGGAFAPYGPLAGSSPHPRAYGTFPRLLGRYVRERGLLSLEQAIHKITGMPAAKLGLTGRGRIRPGAHADLVAFDPDSVRDRATFQDPHRYPEGIPLVVVNGVIALRDGEQTGHLAGRAVLGQEKA